ncbi:metal ABC transporter solute-binding protein, Zn/Mn family [Paenibacillus thermoaerophilus]|uniref:Metal ABC transporter solute-binding protein, Zn/Mn family n=1 Tax=Paenibacillus thermoaerophilus TaxID=1215385 RepID=A0ABW2V153_9BACL
MQPLPKKMPGPFKRAMLTVAYVAMIALAACSPAGEEAEFKPLDGDRPVKITTTIGMITDVAKEIGGEHVQVTGLMKAGIDPHLYKASQGDIKRLDEADLILYNGLHLEGKMAEVLDQMNRKKPTIAVTKNIPESELLAGDPESGTQHDPHVWFDVKLWMKAAEVIRDELVKIDPTHADTYKKNAEAYLQKMEELDRYAREQLATIPPESRVLVTAHDAFGYFGRAYGVEVKGLQGISTASETGTKDVADLRDLLVQRKIKAVFVESSVPADRIRAVIEGAKQLGHDVKIGGELFSDAMGPEGTEEGTYLGMVRHNVDTIVKALK